MNVLILGHNGFIGQEIFKLFNNLFPAAGEVNGLSFPEVDLCRYAGVEKAAEYFTPETIVIMCAGIKRQLGDNLNIFRQNLNMVENICEILQQCPVKKFVYFSSSAVYGEDIHNTQISEETFIQARSFYGIAKYAAERLLWKTISEFPQSGLSILRPTLVYGYGDETKSYGPSGFLNKLASDEEIVLWGDGSELREFLYVHDIARIVCEVARSSFNGILNPVSGRSHSFREVLDLLADMMKKKPKIVYRERTKAKIDNVFSARLLRNCFPDFRFTALAEGLKEMVELERCGGKR